ncbi:MAG: hypothetical protein JW914_01475 [Syntrophaceae bacterium]|nr:hypothetical protein [Syntrophaceae bacterium]
MPDYQNTFLELLENLELDISNLYKLFAEKFPAHKQLWDELSGDEVQHAGYIKKLSSFIQQRLVLLDEKTTKTLTIKIVSEGIKSTYRQAQDNKLTSINALAYSLSLEDSILEKKFYDYFITHDQNVAFVINKIKWETNQHYQKVKIALEEAKKSR